MTRSGVDVGPFAFLDPLLGRAALIVERHDPLGWARQVRHDEADAGIEFARMPLDLGHDAARRLPALRPVAEAGVVPVGRKFEIGSVMQLSGKRDAALPAPASP